MEYGKYCYIDFEFTKSKEKHLNLICCSLKFNGTTQTYWLQEPFDNRQDLINILTKMNKENTQFVAYQVVAEARCFLTLGIDPTTCQWIDLHLEDKMLTNSNEEYGYGDQLVDGKEVKTFNYTRYDDEWSPELNCSKPQRNYASCCYRFLDKLLVDTDRKNEIRDLIITKEKDFNTKEIQQIIEYCESDVEHLPKILDKVLEIYKEYDMPEQPEAMLQRAEYSALTAIMEAEGYPVNEEALRKFQASTSIIMNECMRDIAEKCDTITDCKRYTPFEKKGTIHKCIRDLEGYYLGISPEEVIELFGDDYDRMRSRKKAVTAYRNYLAEPTWKMNTTNIRKWINDKSGLLYGWEKTKTGALSLSKDSWQKKYNYSHDYPDDKYEAQIIRFLKLKESMNGFLPNSKKPITNNLGVDGRIRPYMNIYGAQSSRSQPSSSSFIFLKAAWTRVLVHPKPDKVIVAIDYSSQEVLVQGILSAMFVGKYTTAMIESYSSGDVYLDFAKKAGAVPQDATKQSHKNERDLFKSTFLGIGYGMGARSLARKLTSDTGKHVDEEVAEELIEQFYEIYSDYAVYLQQLESDYEDSGKLQLLDHWTLFGDNYNIRSVKNFMIQGNAAVVMRRAVKLCKEYNLKCIKTLHDALYVEMDADENLADNVSKFNLIMRKAVTDTFKHPAAKLIRTDVTVWGDYFENNTLNAGYEEKRYYVDERSRKDYDFFSKYFI